MAPPPFVCSFHSWKQGYVPVLLRFTVLWNGLHKLIFHDNTVFLLTILFWKFVQNCHEKFRKKEVKNIKKKVNCNRSPTAKVYMFVKKKKPTQITSIYSKQNIIFFHLHFTVVFVHTYKILCRKTYISQFLKCNIVSFLSWIEISDKYWSSGSV